MLPYLVSKQAVLYTSQLTRLECRVRPIKQKNLELQKKYDDLFDAERLCLLELSPQVVDKATELRAHGFKTPDALHLASASIVQADRVLTGDAEWKRCREVHVDVVAS